MDPELIKGKALQAILAPKGDRSLYLDRAFPTASVLEEILAFPGIDQLEKLVISYDGSGDVIAKALKSAMAAAKKEGKRLLPNLTHLNINFSRMNDEHGKILKEFLEQSNVTELHISGCRFSPYLDNQLGGIAFQNKMDAARIKRTLEETYSNPVNGNTTWAKDVDHGGRGFSKIINNNDQNPLKTGFPKTRIGKA